MSLTNCLENGSYTNCNTFSPTSCPYGSVTVSNSYYAVSGSYSGTHASATELADGTIATALQAGREEEVWVQDPVTNQPMLKLFANTGLKANAHDGLYWTTYYCGTAGHKIADGENACAYTATYSESTLTLHKLGKVIPQGTAVVIVGDDDDITMEIDNVSAAEYSVSNNLHGVDAETATSTLGTGTFYVMGMKNAHFGFHEYTGTTMAARKAYLLVSGGAALARGIDIVFGDDATGINMVDGSESMVQDSDAWYTLDGRRLSGAPTECGVYVSNGRKIIVK